MDRGFSRRAVLQGGGAGAAVAGLGPWGRRASAQEATPAAGEFDRAAVEAALPALTELAETAVRDGAVPGLAMAVVFEDEVVLSAGYGVRSTESGEPVTPDTVFHLASMAKPVASTVVSAVVGTGAATWNDPVIAHLPGFLLADPWATRELTITDFMSHISGLGGDAGGDLERIGYARDEIIARLRYLALASSPRTHYAYSNIGFTVGGLAAAGALDMTWEDASEELLYAPLGMTSTSSRYADFEAETNRAPLHVWIDNRWQPAFTFNSDTQAPAGGVNSTVNDLVQWLRLILGDGTVDGVEIIPAAPLLEARRPLVDRGTNPLTGHPSFYGRGWNLGFDIDGNVILGHAGAFSLGARTAVSVRPARQLAIVTLTSAFPTGVPDGLNDSLFDLVEHGRLTQDWIAGWNTLYAGIGAAFAASGEPYETAPASPSPALPASAYTGVYANDYAGPVEISGEDGALELSMGPEPRVFALTPFERDVFTYHVDLEPPAPLTGATFVVGPDGTAHTLILDYFAGNGQQYFPRVAEN
jgi:CubicO group peptidase (beta-lactamase class C family)